jgi:hypothetical protein
VLSAVLSRSVSSKYMHLSQIGGCYLSLRSATPAFTRSSIHFEFTFCYQGIPTVLLGVGCFFFLPDRPESTSYLTNEEQKLAADRMNRGASRDNGAFVNKSKSPSNASLKIYGYTSNSPREHIWAAFRDWRVGAVSWTKPLALIMVCSYMSQALSTSAQIAPSRLSLLFCQPLLLPLASVR